MNAAGGFPGQPQRKYDPYSSTYNPGWRDHPNLSYGNPQVNQPATQNRPSYQQYKQPYLPRQQLGQTSNSGMSLEDIVKSLATNTLQFQQETRASIQSLDNQMGQMATAISQLEAQSSGKLPSQTDESATIPIRIELHGSLFDKCPTPYNQTSFLVQGHIR